MGNNSGKGFGFSIGGSGGGGGGTVTSLTTTGTSGASTLSSGTLNIPIYADTNTNLGNTNLSVDEATRKLDVDGNTLNVVSGLTNIMTFNGSADTVAMGQTNTYVFPTDSGTTTGALLQSNNATGRLGFVRGGFSIPFTMYMQGLSAFDSNVSKWHYPEPMSNNKFLALIRSSGIAGANNVEESWDQLTSTTLRSCTLGGTPVAAVLDTVNCWVSVLDNDGNLTPSVTLELIAFSPVEGSTEQLLPTKLLSVESAVTGDSNNKFYNIRNTTQGTIAVPGGALIMPILKLSIEGEAPETLSFDVWVNGSAHFYLTST